MSDAPPEVDKRTSAESRLAWLRDEITETHMRMSEASASKANTADIGAAERYALLEDQLMRLTLERDSIGDFLNGDETAWNAEDWVEASDDEPVPQGEAAAMLTPPGQRFAADGGIVIPETDVVVPENESEQDELPMPVADDVPGVEEAKAALRAKEDAKRKEFSPDAAPAALSSKTGSPAVRDDDMMKEAIEARKKLEANAEAQRRAESRRTAPPAARPETRFKPDPVLLESNRLKKLKESEEWEDHESATIPDLPPIVREGTRADPELDEAFEELMLNAEQMQGGDSGDSLAVYRLLWQERGYREDDPTFIVADAVAMSERRVLGLVLPLSKMLRAHSVQIVRHAEDAGAVRVGMAEAVPLLQEANRLAPLANEAARDFAEKTKAVTGVLADVGNEIETKSVKAILFRIGQLGAVGVLFFILAWWLKP